MGEILEADTPQNRQRTSTKGQELAENFKLLLPLFDPSRHSNPANNASRDHSHQESQRDVLEPGDRYRSTLMRFLPGIFNNGARIEPHEVGQSGHPHPPPLMKLGPREAGAERMNPHISSPKFGV